MRKSVEFIRPNDLSIIESENNIVLRKGFLHINEIIIDKDGSSNSFINLMKEFMKNNKVIISENDLSYDDFMQLTKFGLVDIAMNKNYLLIINDKYRDLITQLCPKFIEIKTTSDFFDEEDIKVLSENKNALILDTMNNKYRSILRGYDHIYYLEQFCNLVRNRAVNRLLNSLEVEYTMGIFDNENIYLTGIKPNYTGCYECLEKHIISKFDGTVKEYNDKYDKSVDAVSNRSDITLLMGMVLKDMNNINKYGASSLTGNVVQFYTSNFEYSFNVNRKSTSCSVCAKINNVKFEEQNIRSINAIKEVLSE